MLKAKKSRKYYNHFIGSVAFRVGMTLDGNMLELKGYFCHDEPVSRTNRQILM